MKRQLLASVAVVALFGGSALAADLPVKARPMPTCPGCNWNGFYVGLNLGGSIGHDASQDSISLNPAGGFGNERYREGLGGPQGRDDVLLGMIADRQGLERGGRHIRYGVDIRLGLVPDDELRLHLSRILIFNRLFRDEPGPRPPRAAIAR